MISIIGMPPLRMITKASHHMVNPITPKMTDTMPLISKDMVQPPDKVSRCGANGYEDHYHKWGSIGKMNPLASACPAACFGELQCPPKKCLINDTSQIMIPACLSGKERPVCGKIHH
jgi:hypothetical protein